MWVRVTGIASNAQETLLSLIKCLGDENRVELWIFFVVDVLYKYALYIFIYYITQYIICFVKVKIICKSRDWKKYGKNVAIRFLAFQIVIPTLHSFYSIKTTHFSRGFLLHFRPQNNNVRRIRAVHTHAVHVHIMAF